MMELRSRTKVELLHVVKLYDAVRLLIPLDSGNSTSSRNPLSLELEDEQRNEEKIIRRDKRIIL